MKPGDVLSGRYRLVELLGKGGMAEVWKADDRERAREVAVKLVRPPQELIDWFGAEDMNRDRAELHGRFRREGALPAARSPRAGGWISRRSVEEILTEVGRELARGEAGPATERLAELLPVARRQFGADPLVGEARMACADSLRITGDCGRAGALYRQQAEDLAQKSDPPSRAMGLVARLGVAECRIPFGELDVALDGLRAVAAEAGVLPADLLEPVVAGCEELGVELSELGREEEVEEILASLPRRTP
ncbi:hypothetical protein ABZV14_32100 [Streptosporangium canum]|uniref:hypothetical protein n=1 Tax=Streptosporangium canum TaxID=324952 RepID=UPI0033A6C65A